MAITEHDRVTLNVTECAARLGISRGLCYRLLREGRLPMLRLGRRLLVPRKALEDMLAVNEKQALQETARPRE